MAILLQINKLNYKINDDKIFDISLDVQKGDYISIIAPNKSGKTILTKLICAIIPTDNMFQIDGIILNKENVLDYLEKIGIVSNELNIFLTKKVKDELTLPLKNLGYSANALHNHEGKFYTRDKVYKNLGFDSFTSIEYMDNIERTPLNWAKDKVLTSEIIKVLDSTSNQDMSKLIEILESIMKPLN